MQRVSSPIQIFILVFTTIVLSLSITRPLQADVIRLKNGNALEGRITEEKDDHLWLQIGAGGGVRIWKNDIVSIERSAPAAEPVEEKVERRIQPPKKLEVPKESRPVTKPPVQTTPVLPQRQPPAQEEGPTMPISGSFLTVLLLVAIGILIYARKKRADSLKALEEAEEPLPPPTYEPYADYEEGAGGDGEKAIPPTGTGGESIPFDGGKDSGEPLPPWLSDAPLEVDETVNSEKSSHVPSHALSEPGAELGHIRPPEESEEGLPREIHIPFLIKIIISSLFLKALFIGAGGLFFISLVRNGFLPSTASLSTISILTAFFVGLNLVPAFGLLFMRRWARILVVILIALGIMGKFVDLSANINIYQFLTNKFFAAELRKEKYQVAPKDLTKLIDMIQVVRAMDRSLERNQGLDALSTVLKRARMEDIPVNPAKTKKAVLSFLLLIDFLLLLYFLKRGEVLDAFDVSGGVPLRYAMRPQVAAITVIVLIFLAILADRTYAFIARQLLRVPDHLTTHPTTLKKPIEPDQKLLDTFLKHRVYGYTILLPPELSRQQQEHAFAAFFLKEDKSLLCAVVPLSEDLYRASLAASKARWNPYLLLLKGMETPSTSGASKVVLIHSKYWEGTRTQYGPATKSGITDYGKTGLDHNQPHAIVNYKIVFGKGRGLEITFTGNSQALDIRLLDTIVSAIEPIGQAATLRKNEKGEIVADEGVVGLDVIYFKHGSSIEGTIIDEDDSSLTVEFGSGRMTIDKTTVTRIEKAASGEIYTPQIPPEQRAAEKQVSQEEATEQMPPSLDSEDDAMLKPNQGKEAAAIVSSYENAFSNQSLGLLKNYVDQDSLWYKSGLVTALEPLFEVFTHIKIYTRGETEIAFTDGGVKVTKYAIHLYYNTETKLNDINEGFETYFLNPSGNTYRIRGYAKLDPNEQRRHYEIATRALLDDDTEKAVDQFKRVIRINPAHSAAHFRLGQLYFAQNNKEAAIEELEKAVELQPDIGLYHFYLSQLLLLDDQTADRGRELLMRAIELDPGVADFLGEQLVEKRARDLKETVEGILYSIQEP